MSKQVEEAETNADKKKKILIVVILLAAAALAAVFWVNASKKGYRLIQIYEINGEAYIERGNTGEMDAYENITLQSGDLMGTKEESWARLKMDEDKYMLVEPVSVLSMVAIGDDNKSRTDVEIKQGAVTVEIQNKLSEDSNYQITTPNSVMAVRGTVFRVLLEEDENGNPVTRLITFEGEVGVRKKNEDGSLSEESVVVGGKEALIYQDGEDTYIEFKDNIDYEDLPTEVLEYLRNVITEHDRKLSVSDKEITNIIDGRKSEKPENTTQTESTKEQQKTKEEQQENHTTEEQKEQETTPVSGKENNTETGKQETGESQNEESKTYTVKFMYEGKAFAEQRIAEGGLAVKPKLSPSLTGSWDYNFNTPVTGDIQIEYKQ